MKKVILIFAALVASATMFAQQKGDMYVSGNLGLGLNSSVSNLSTSVNVSSESHKGLVSATDNKLNFGIAPKFGYFVADNFEVNVALKYNLGFNGRTGKEQMDGESESSTPVSDNIHTFMVAPGISYYLPLVNGKLYYAPSFGIGIGMMAGQEKEGSTTTSSDPIFAFGMYLDLASFEYKLNSRMALTANFAGLQYTMVTKTETKTQTIAGTEVKTKANANVNYVDFGFGNVTVGFKFYF